VVRPSLRNDHNPESHNFRPRALVFCLTEIIVAYTVVTVRACAGMEVQRYGSHPFDFLLILDSCLEICKFFHSKEGSIFYVGKFSYGTYFL